MQYSTACILVEFKCIGKCHLFFVCLFDFLLMFYLAEHNVCLLLPLVAHLSNFNELSLNCQPDVTMWKLLLFNINSS